MAVATGFVFRPGCSTIGTALVALVLGGAYLPVPANMVGQAVGPLLVYCAYTYAAGPADPVFLQTDAAVGPTLTSTLEPVTAQVGGLIAPYRSQFGDACGYSPLVAAPIASIPAPLNRIDPLRILCG
ncbi:MAG: hypothetical protein L0271_22985 [Gemmatimonadetes bacterium]|nr:hypothetical protein [Gemmatimonadota bacterium]